ncbi:MAG: hypothetical protein L0Z49_03575, partial [Actinobacteria bacterium]|nr:hypothetical protein [Actinomycetota bacterium]
MIDIQAEVLSEAGFTAAKPIAEAITWGVMQTGPENPIDFGRLDDMVATFQAVGFTDFTLALKPHSSWASIDAAGLRSTNPAPRPEFLDDYANWVGAVVERYDADGVDDMPGLAHPIRHYEIGSEFSSYEPEPVDVYLETLEIAYESAHTAYPEVMVGHAAFLVMGLLVDHPDPATILDGLSVDRYGPHDFGDIRAILDRPELFDYLNIHALAHPGEIEEMVAWLDWETAQRGYRKPIVISDTSPNPFVAFGPATMCDRPAGQMGFMFYPATEEDRCRIADYFGRVLDQDPDTLEWLRAYVAADMVKKVVISAEQGIALINTSFVIDLPFLDAPIGQAGAGNAGWGGMMRIGSGTTYPNLLAMGQLMGKIDDSSAVRRLDIDGPEGTRVYELVE